MEITLRPYKLSDADDFMEWGCDDEVIRSSRLRHCIELSEGGGHTPSMVPSHMLEQPSSRIHLLCARLFHREMPGNDQLCSWIQVLGQGITTLALKRAGFFNCVKFVESPDVQRIEGVVEVNNKASQRVLEKAGFLREGVLRKHLFVKERSIIDVVMYSLLSTDPVSYHKPLKSN